MAAACSGGTTVEDDSGASNSASSTAQTTSTGMTSSTTGAGGMGGGLPMGECGDGAVSANEQCDLGALNGGESCCDANCMLVSAGTVCRASEGGDCDAAEVCDGVSDACPANASAPVGTPCGSALGEPTCNPDACDAQGQCTDVTGLSDGSGCSDNGGDTCCGAACVAGVPSQGSCCELPPLGVLTVAIITSPMLGQNMDTEWLTVAQGLGHTATIEPESFLDNVANLANTDVLVVSSGTAPLLANRLQTIQTFLTGGGGVYLQGEYQASFAHNQAFATLVNATGGTWTWGNGLTGDLQPATALGCWAAYPTSLTTPLDYFWFGITGSGSPEPILQSSGSIAVGWSWCLAQGGQLVHVTDKDFINQASAEDHAFMGNVLQRLGNAANCTQP